MAMAAPLILVDIRGTPPFYANLRFQFDKRFRVSLRRHLRKAGSIVATHMKKKKLNFGSPAPNSLPWAAVKGSNTPLYNTGFTLRQIRNRVYIGTGDVYAISAVGFPNETPHPLSGGVTVPKILDILRRGATFTPSPRQKKAFWARVPKDFPRPTTSQPTWRIPARDFLNAMRLEAYLKVPYQLAVKAALREAIWGK